MKKKNKKNKFSISFSIIIIVFLLNTSFLKTLNTQALLEENYKQHTTDSFDQLDWKWTTTEVVSTESTSFSRFPSHAVDSEGNVHIAWHDNTDYDGAGTDYDIFYKRWDFKSSSWTTTEVISSTSSDPSYEPSLAVDSAGNVHIAWVELEDIYYKLWNSSILAWTTSVLVSTEYTVECYEPSLAVDSAGNVHIAWCDYNEPTDWDIFYKRWNASSFSWTGTGLVSTDSTADSYHPSLTVDSVGNLHIAWHDNTDYDGAGTDYDIFYKRWNISSSTWTTTEVVSTESTETSYRPSLAIDFSDNLHVAWYDPTEYDGAGVDWDIFYKRWNNSSSTWTTTEVVSTESTRTSVYPSLAVDSNGNIHIAWQDISNYAGAGTDYDIFYKRWDIISSTWTTTEIVSTESTDTSSCPSLAVDSASFVYVTWYDLTDYAGAGVDDDIFYKSYSGNLATPELAFIIPNPDYIGIVYLDWNDVYGAFSYYVYRSTSYIWIVEGLTPIATVSSSEYFDSISSEGFYYYRVVAENYLENSTLSNCLFVEVKFPDLEAPELSFVLPNPTDIDSVSLVWDDVDGATDYYIYRSNSFIWSVDSLVPIATVSSNSYLDTLPDEGYYFYVIVATDGVRNSTHSNCEHILYDLPSLDEFVVISGIIFGTFAILFVITQIRKKKAKLN